MAKRIRIQSLLLACATILACEASTEPLAVRQSSTTDVDVYGFSDGDEHARLESVFDTPTGFARISTPGDSFAAWLRQLPVRLDRTHVLSYRGDLLRSPSAAVIAIDVGARNLQQCADSAIRLHAEFLWSQKRFGELAYHFTSGDEVSYSAWLTGERIVVNGAKVRRVRGPARQRSRVTFRDWLDLVFMYAGTRSLRRDSEPVPAKAVRAGDFFVAPGSPGHAIVVLDVAESSDGRRIALLGQGFMPAQDFHVLRATGSHVVDNVWFRLPAHADEELRTPSWKPFHGSDARRFSPQ